jgi:hypothetical protein
LGSGRRPFFRQRVEGLQRPGDHRKTDNSGSKLVASSIDLPSVERQTTNEKSHPPARMARSLLPVIRIVAL